MKESTLLSNNNSEEFENENLLTNRPNRVSVVVEDEDDIRFWNDLLKYSCPDKEFEIDSFQNNSDGSVNISKGKCNILSDISRYGKYKIACVDSDLDYLLPDVSVHRDAIKNKHVIQTLVYSIENFMCESKTLDDVCFNSTCYHSDFDFVDFCRKLSVILFPLLKWVVYLQSVGDVDIFKLDDDWGKILDESDKYTTQDEERLLNNVESLVCRKLYDFVDKYPEKQTEVDELSNNLSIRCFFSEQNALMFVRGHDLFNYILKVLIKPICKQIKDNHVNLIKTSTDNDNGRKQKREHYLNKCRRDCEFELKDNFKYKHTNPFVSSIVDRIQAALE